MGFFVATGDGRVCVGPKTTHITSQKVDFCIDGGDFLFSRGIYYSYMSSYKKYRSASSLSHKKYYQFSISDNGRGGVGPMTTH